MFKRIVFTLLLSLALSTSHFTPAQAAAPPAPIGNRDCSYGNVVGSPGDVNDELPYTYFVALEGSGYVLSGGEGCTGSVIIAPGVTTIGYGAFQFNFSLTSITIPNSVTTIGTYAFDTTSLNSVAFGNSVTTIGYGAFYSNTSLTSITIPNSVTTIGYGAFSSNTSLTAVTIGNSVTTIGDYAFEATSLTSITIPNSVTTIGVQAFSSNTSLTAVTIGNSVTTIGQKAFYSTGLTSITIPNSVTSIGSQAFGTIPAFTLTSSSETVAINTAAIGFEIVNLSALADVFSITPTPLGMSFDRATGALTGTPSTAAPATAYTVRATNGSFSASTIFTLTVTGTTATAPAAPTLNSVTGGNKQLTIAFTPGDDGGAAITDYEYSLNGAPYISAGITTSPFTITGLNGRTAYSVTIKARNSVGLSTASSSLSATTTDSSRDTSEAAAAEAARVVAANAAAEAAKKQKELTELLSVIPSIAGLALNLGDLTNTLLLKQKCVQGTKTKYVKKGAKCPKGYVRKK